MWSGVSAWVSDAPFCIVEIQLLIVFFVHQLSMLLCFQLVLACLALCVLSKEGSQTIHQQKEEGKKFVFTQGNISTSMSSAVQCAVCYCDVVDEAGQPVVEDGVALTSARCGGAVPHVVCQFCLDGYLDAVTSAPDKRLLDGYAKTGGLRCALCEDALDEAALFGSGAGGELLRKYSTVVRRVANAVERRVALEESLKKQEGGAAANGKVVEHVIGKVDELLSTSIACPHCGAAFFDFNGCMSLTCGLCNKEFCGVCLKVHRTTSDGHAAVLECLGHLPAAELEKYGMRRGDYFMSNAGGENWERWKERIKVGAVLRYLGTLTKDVVWSVVQDVLQHLRASKLLTEAALEELQRKVFSHDVNAVHLIRIPNIFWLLYSSKHDVRFERAVELRALEQDERIQIGQLVVAAVRKRYPGWVAMKERVPGEDFPAINYPPEAMSIIAKVIEQWGADRKIWEMSAYAGEAPVTAAAAGGAPQQGGGRGGRGGGGGAPQQGGGRGRGGRGGRGY